MNRRSTLVDFGPTCLPMSADGLQAEIPGQDWPRDLAREARKLKGLLAAARGESNPDSENSEMPIPAVGETGTAFASAKPQTHGLGHVGALITAGVTAIAAAQDCNVRMVSLTVKSESQPDTFISIEENGQTLVFSLKISNENAAQRLANDLESLALEVGSKIKRPIEIHLFSEEQSRGLIRSAQFDGRRRS